MHTISLLVNNLNFIKRHENSTEQTVSGNGYPGSYITNMLYLIEQHE